MTQTSPFSIEVVGRSTACLEIRQHDLWEPVPGEYEYIIVPLNQVEDLISLLRKKVQGVQMNKWNL